MDLPEGINQDSACFLIAMRDLLEDPDYADPMLVESMRTLTKQAYTTGNTRGSGPAWEVCDVILADPRILRVHHLPASEGNPDCYLVRDRQNNEYYVPRNASCLLTYQRTDKGYHTLTGPFHVIRSMMKYISRWEHMAVLRACATPA